MSVTELLDRFKELSKEDRLRFLEGAQRVNETLGMLDSNLRAGVKVQFRNTKTGVLIKGMFVRMKQRYAEVETRQDRYGLQTDFPTIWNVPPQALIVEPS